MLRLIVTLAVGLGLLVGVGAFFDPEGAREAIRRDMAGLADAAVRQAGDVVRDAVERATAPAADGVPETPKAGPRTGKKRPPVIAGSPAPAAEPREEVAEVAVAARTGFVEAPLIESRPRPTVTSAGSAARLLAPGDESDAAVGASDRTPVGELESAPADVAEQGMLIRRMLALYERVTERR
jgi:hypothetical protein